MCSKVRGIIIMELDSQFLRQKKQIEKIVEETIQKNNIVLNETTFKNLVIHLFLSVIRQLNGSYIYTSESQMNSLKENEYYEIATQLIHQIENEFHISLDETQISYATMYLANIQLLDIDFNCQFDFIDDDIETIINKTLILIKNELGIDMKKNKDFYTGMTLHFLPAIERLKNNEQLMDNPLMDYIQTNHQKAYQCSMIFNRVVKNHYNKSFNEHELAYIALHFGTAFSE